MLTFVWSSLHLFRGAVPVVIAPLLLSIAIATAYALWGPSPRSRPYAKIPIASFDANEYAERGREVLNRGTATGGLFQINAGTEWQIIIPAAFADELKSHPDLLFHKAHALELLPYYPGFEAFKVGIDEGQFIHEVTQRKLTPKLGLVTEGIVDETIAAFEERFGESKEWHTQALQADALEFCARVGTRISLGKRLARHAEMIEVFKSYTHDCIAAVMKMKNYPQALQPIMYRFTQESKKTQQHYRKAKQLITPEIERSRRELESGKKGEGDLSTWMIETARGRKIDLVGAHMVLQVLGNGNMAELWIVCALQLCESPECVQPLREEIVSVLREDGWTKAAFSKMRLLDSFMKEVHRLHPAQIAPMRRLAAKNITCSNGQVIPKGALLHFYDNGAWDSTLYPDPHKFDFKRHLLMREEPGEENKHKFVTTTAKYMGFGHGIWACPGRFIADDQIKIALCVFLLKHDVRLPPNPPAQPIRYFQNMCLATEEGRIQVRRRDEELDPRSLLKNQTV